MFDFRYHALSLAAVLLALAIGLLLGVAIGDEGLVSSAESNLREDLRGDVRDARSQARAAQGEIDRRQRYEEQTFGAVVGERLQGRRIAVLLVNQTPADAFRDVRDAVEPAGGELASVSRLRLPPDLKTLERDALGTRYEGLSEDDDTLRAFGRRMGEQLIQGGQLLDSIKRDVFASSSGSLERAEGVAIVRVDPGERSKRDADISETFVAGLLDGILSTKAPLVGIERVDTDPSQIGWYRDHGLPSVDNVDEPAGRASLVMLLAGQADGAFGVKASADALLPEALSPDE